MNFTITHNLAEFHFQISPYEVDLGQYEYGWQLVEGNKIMDDADSFISDFEAQESCMRYANSKIDEMIAHNDAQGEERAGKWEWMTSRL